MSSQIKIVIGQLNFLVGDIQYNVNKMLQAAQDAKNNEQADLIIFPELSLTGYLPEDLLWRQDFHIQVQKGLQDLAKKAPDIDIIVGYPEKNNDGLFNALAVIEKNKITTTYFKQRLPNYGVFDEKRYFKPGVDTCVLDYHGFRIGLLICEDIWENQPSIDAKNAGAEIIFVINASPFDVYKLREREKILQTRIQETHIPFVYVHCIGGQDEIVFDGRSIVINQQGETTHLAPPFQESLLSVIIKKEKNIEIIAGEISEKLSDEARVYLALVQATRDYVLKNGFKKVALGLSGGIDSALVLCIAVDALGKDNVRAIIMPSRYTAEMSLDDAKTLANNLGVKYTDISIESVFSEYIHTLADEFAGTKPGIAEENLQARIRGMLLMAISNKFGDLILTTGNKSEMAVGYATLYGDMAGGFAVLKDVYKTLVYRLAKYCNQEKEIIPHRIIERAPSAELRFDQTDQDSLPPYEILDAILELFIEKDLSLNEIVANDFDKDTVKAILQLVTRNEYKRRQSAPGPKITARAFGRERRYPITHGFHFDE